MVRIIDLFDMTVVVNWDVINLQNKQANNLKIFEKDFLNKMFCFVSEDTRHEERFLLQKFAETKFFPYELL